ncbi:MAG TPA: Uma2 family endonuclease [Isosphaeraceae bacterium]|nr:Uma2 family endonuclease [Isosphaeraceae bacterium]
MSIAITPARRSEIEYPDSDGQPMAENTLQFQWIVTIKEGLEAAFRNDPNVFVAGDLFWYPEEGKPNVRTAPDIMAVFGRPKGHRGSYKQWEEAGIAPQVVFEVLSPSNRPAETIRKFRFYERYGVEEYYIYNPDNGDLSGWLRGSAGLEEIEDMNGHTSPRLGVRFEAGEGPDELRIIGPDGRPFATYMELFEDREALRERAEAEHERAEAERQRAEAASQRADRLAAKLRELGVETE